MKYILLIVSGLFFNNIYSQDTLPKYYSNEIQTNKLQEYITVLASDEFEGRETGDHGQRKAAEYIVSKFKEIGLTPGNGNSFEQFFSIAEIELGGHIIVNSDTLLYGDDFIPFFFDYKFSRIYDDALVIDMCSINDVKEKAVANKTLFIISEKCDKSIYEVIKKLNKLKPSSIVIVSKEFEKYKTELESFHGRSYLLNDTSFTENLLKNIPLVLANPKSFSLNKKSNNVSWDVNSIEIKEGSNIPGLLVGSDPLLKNEYIVISAHYDHLGISGDLVYNGADDNGTGTGAIIALAEAFVKAKNEGNGPKRSIIFLPVSGEEKGLLGSDYYTQNPTVDLSSIVTDLNIDMIGRIDDQHKNEPNYIYLIGSDRISKDLHNISEEANEEFTKFNIDYTYNDPKDPNRYYYRSDHYNFAKNGIPSIFYFSGIHEDYHKATDTIEKIDFERVTKVTQLVFHTAWKISNRKEKPKVD